ncbi:V-type ATP synthase subunit D [hydrothermal vent metagenome]|uniref:V-type ATP synthase subunit D n=1 Tax=hydrothermal vent metagenome TaxID=652676 RepID=A0A3B1DBB2_9ZZZZ
MAKIKFTKGELKKQRDGLKQFRRYLPTLLLKKQQLQMKILEARKVLDERQAALNSKVDSIEPWAGLLAEPHIDLKAWITPERIDTTCVNIAGASVPVFEKVHFKPVEYDFYTTPFWLDRGIEEIRLFMTLRAEVDIIKEQIRVLEKELRTTTQRVNLFEKIMIPECLDNIRQIRIYLGDQQANAVGISKVAKKKVDARNLEEALV